MLDFALITGLEPTLKHPKRYLWTDAFAICNYLELYSQTGDKNFLDLALKLVDQVHYTLGRYREDDRREGWISGLEEDDGKLHPTKGGLRIGKDLNERQPGEPFIERLEWDRDGQYYHYLTKWIHALSRVSITAKDPVYVEWALELAQAAHHGFTYATLGGTSKMYWKMSIDLRRPQVSSMGQQDPLDGYITYNEIQEAGRCFRDSPDLPNLKQEIEDIAQICSAMSWLTDDPLGMGGLLSDSLKIGQLLIKNDAPNRKRSRYEDLLINLLQSALFGLELYSRNNPPDLAADYRLAFREMGLSIGIKGVEYLYNILKLNKTNFEHYNIHKQISKSLLDYMPLAVSLEDFWMNDENQKSNTWTEHREINMVMLATSLAPCGFLRI